MLNPPCGFDRSDGADAADASGTGAVRPGNCREHCLATRYIAAP
jgi:hypothetical protein